MEKVMTKADEYRKEWYNKWYKPANEAVLAEIKEKIEHKFLHRKDRCWWCNKEFKKDDTKVTHGIFNYLGVYFCDNNSCLDNFLDCNNL